MKQGDGADHDVRFGEPVRRADRGQHANHGTHRMSHVDNRTWGEFLDQFEQIGSVPVKRAVFIVIIGGEVRISAAYQVEQDSLVAFAETGSEIAPHGLVAAKAVSKNDCGRTTAVDVNIVALANVHGKP